MDYASWIDRLNALISSLSTAEIVAIFSVLVAAAGVLVNFIYTSITLFLWLATRRTIQLNSAMVEQNAKMIEHLALQVKHQIALSHSTSEHNIIDSHRDLFLGIVEHPQLLELFADASNLSPEVAQRNILGTLLINHASSIYYYHKNNVITPAHLESFIKDARDLFKLPFLRERWKTVKDFHTHAFQEFMESVILSEREINFMKLQSEPYGSSENLVEVLTKTKSEP